MVEEPNFIETVQVDVQLPPSILQQENEGQRTLVEISEHLDILVHGTVPTPLPPLANTRRRTLKRI